MQVQFLAPLWWLTAIHNSSNGSDAVFWPPWVPGTQAVYRYTLRQISIHIKINLTNKQTNKQTELLVLTIEKVLPCTTQIIGNDMAGLP